MNVHSCGPRHAKVPTRDVNNHKVCNSFSATPRVAPTAQTRGANSVASLFVVKSLSSWPVEDNRRRMDSLKFAQARRSANNTVVDVFRGGCTQSSQWPCRWRGRVGIDGKWFCQISGSLTGAFIPVTGSFQDYQTQIKFQNSIFVPDFQFE